MAPNSNLISTIASASQKTYSYRHISCTEVRFSNRSLEVIWWLQTQIRWTQSPQHPKTTLKDTLHVPKWDLVVILGVIISHLRSFEGHLLGPNSNLMSAIDSASKNKTYIKASNILVRIKFSGHYRSLDSASPPKKYSRTDYMPKKEILFL